MNDHDPNADRGPDHSPDKPAPLDGSVEQKLALYIEAAAAERPRLHPHAVARIEERLNTLAAHDDPTQGRFWRGLRVPAYIGATALVAVLLWSWLPRGGGAVYVASSEPAPLAVPLAHPVVPMRLDDGTLQLRTEALPLVATIVETPAARVEVAPQSVVSITVTGSAVRILATSGSARILYYDGRTELVAPIVSAAVNVPAAPTQGTRPQHHARVQGAVPNEEPRPAASPVSIPPAVPATAPLDGERASFTSALTRVRNAPTEALALFDAYLLRYPDGAYASEAARVRIAVLIRLQRKPEALTALDHIASPSTELRVMRAELRVDALRYEEAIGDFGAVIFADAGEDHFAQRALYGRALARQKLGDRVRMSEDLTRYLLLYPRGEYADRVRIELRRATSEASR